MRIVVFGANGRVGQLLVVELLKRGHTVRAFVHGKTLFTESEKLQITTGDIYDFESVNQAVQGMDLVVSTLGSWGTPKKDILTVGMQHIIPAMHAYRINKIVTLTGTACNVPGDKKGLMHNVAHLVFSITAGKILRDGENHLRQLESSRLNWCTLRSPIMNEKGDPRAYKLTHRRPADWKTINRHSVVQALAELVEHGDYSNQSPFITRS